MGNLRRTDGVAQLAAIEGINDALIEIARRQDFDELKTLTDVSTEADKKSYHLYDDFGLNNIKDIYTIRYIDGTSSRKLIYIPVAEFDYHFPYPEQYTTGKPKWYTLRGLSIELFRIPNAAKTLRFYHSNWPSRLEKDDDESPLSPNMDDTLIAIGTAIAQMVLEGDWAGYAREKLEVSIKEERTAPDKKWVHEGFNPYTKTTTGVEYWKNPCIKRQQ